MGMIVTRRTTEQFSCFKIFLMLLLRICDTDEVWITSKHMTVSLSNAIDRSGDKVKDLLRGKRVFLVTGNDTTGNSYLRNLQADLATTTPHVYVETPPYWDVNEIYLIKENRVVAAIMGSSECIKRDLDKKPRQGDNFEFDTKTDVIHFVSEYDAQIRAACENDPDVRVTITEFGGICICNEGFDLDRMFHDMQDRINRNRQ